MRENVKRVRDMERKVYARESYVCVGGGEISSSVAVSEKWVGDHGYTGNNYSFSAD